MAEKVEKERLDVLLVQRGLAPGRDQAKAYIMAGNVYVDGMKEDKAGTKIPVTAEIEVRDAAMKYVSRGGYKLEKAMEVFEELKKINPKAIENVCRFGENVLGDVEFIEREADKINLEEEKGKVKIPFSAFSA